MHKKYYIHSELCNIAHKFLPHALRSLLIRPSNVVKGVSNIVKGAGAGWVVIWDNEVGWVIRDDRLLSWRRGYNFVHIDRSVFKLVPGH
jgi:hypothetical protein